jgi:hypothetical protein
LQLMKHSPQNKVFFKFFICARTWSSYDQLHTKFGSSLTSTDAPWYVPNSFIARDLSMTVKAAIAYHSNTKQGWSTTLTAWYKISCCSRPLADFKSFIPSDLPTRF